MSDYHAAPLFDVASYARRGPGRRERLSAAEIDQVRRTVGQAPEVMVKVLAGGQPTAKGARQHLDYVGREGELELETDAGERLTGEDAAQRIVDDWDLDLEEGRPGSRLGVSDAARRPKLVHKLVFSMPQGTPADKVLGAVRDFAREEFGLKHRYALVLHTDDDHPHVHVVVKAVSEQGDRLNIRKATLRHWRAEFARQLRAHGVEANATERAVRGQAAKAYTDGVYRAAQRGASTHQRAREQAAVTVGRDHVPESASAARLAATNRAVRDGFLVLAQQLANQGEVELGRATRRFAEAFPLARTDQQSLRERVLDSGRAPQILSRSGRPDPTVLR
jgi:type IV secretory pathway VirD2 relaxase